MESWTAQAQKGRTPATPPFTLYPFRLYESSTIINTMVNDLAKEVVETVSKHALISFFQTWSGKHACNKPVALVAGVTFFGLPVDCTPPNLTTVTHPHLHVVCLPPTKRSIFRHLRFLRSRIIMYISCIKYGTINSYEMKMYIEINNINEHS